MSIAPKTNLVKNFELVFYSPANSNSELCKLHGLEYDIRKQAQELLGQYPSGAYVELYVFEKATAIDAESRKNLTTFGKNADGSTSELL